MRATTDFLLREALTLLLDDPSPRNVAQAMGGEYAKEEAAVAAALMDSQSQTEGSEDSESQAAAISTNTHRVMIVRTTNSAQQLVTLVDRAYSIEAFIATLLVQQLKERHRYKSLSRLRGSVVRVEKYHFVTPTRCRALLEKERGTSQPLSVSTRLARGEQSARLWLHVDGLSVIDDSELAVNPLPELEEHPEVAERLNAMKADALEQRLVLRQNLTPLAPAKDVEDHHPLLDEDCEIPEDQERELDAQEGWGEVEQEGPTDSQLIAENGPVTETDSQPTSLGGMASSYGNTTAVSSSEPQTQHQHTTRVVIPETASESISQADASVPDSQDYHFQRENLATAFEECSDTDSDEDMDANASQKPATGEVMVDLTGNENSSSSSMSGQSQLARENSQPPITQALEASESLPTDSFSSEDSLESQTPGDFVGVVRDDHDEPMTQQADESQANTLLALSSSDRWSTQADEQSQHVEDPDSRENTRDTSLSATITEDFEHDAPEGAEREEQSEQDGQADYWMNTQPKDTHSPEAVASRTLSQLASTAAASPQSASQRRKRRLSRDATSPSEDTRPHSPQEPNTKAARSQRSQVARSTSTSQSSSRGIELPPNPEMFASFMTHRSESASSQQASAVRAIFGISSFNKRNAERQKVRPSNRYQHLLPPFDLASITREIASKKH